MDDVRLRVAGTGTYLPEKVVGNDFFEGRKFYPYNIFGKRCGEGKELTSEGIFDLCGILERHYAGEGETPSSMGTLAAIKAIDNSGIRSDSLVGIILATVGERNNVPSGVCKIQKNLGEHYDVKIPCEAVDITVACAGSVAGMIYANSRVFRRLGNYLVVASEDISGMVQKDDRNLFLFGAGAGAVVLTPSEDHRGIIGEYSISDPYNGNSELITRDAGGFLRMPDGNKVLMEAIRRMVDSAKELKKNVGWEKADVYIAHQANGRILDGIERRVSRDGAVVYRNIGRIGNMSAATCLVALDDAIRKGVVKKNSKVIMTSFGSGLVTAAVAVQF